ncbi:MAG: undecaprenyldiphospho-muramoylpentapeptide beta-N-acetylglucosaminyltransferase [Firmicutes bacterium]|nr:undecaprenyldiphospho-muramoylpentapeptide beta-N-acetylglucosaminyltransferase [Bacillota bacterium]
MKICIVTGGTGGHIYPALALADKYVQMDPENKIVFIGNDDRMEADLIPSYGYPFYALHTSGLVGSVFNKIKAVLQLVSARTKAKGYLKEINPDIVIGFGGYVSAPVIMAATSLKIPTMIHEQNSIVGKANHLIMNKVQAIVTCYTKCEEVFPKDKIHYLGNPRGTLAKEADFDEEYFKSMGLDLNKKTILIMMGSLGSSSVNALMKDALKDTPEDLQFLYVCGKDNLNDIHLFDGYENIHVVGYVDTMRIYGKIDGMICRAGATTLAEVTALGIPSIIIPSPYVANNHQFYNASMLVNEGAALMVEEKDLNATTLHAAIEKLFMDEAMMEKTRQAALNMGKPNAAYDMIALSKKVIGG